MKEKTAVFIEKLKTDKKTVTTAIVVMAMLVISIAVPIAMHHHNKKIKSEETPIKTTEAKEVEQASTPEMFFASEPFVTQAEDIATTISSQNESSDNNSNFSTPISPELSSNFDTDKNSSNNGKNNNENEDFVPTHNSEPLKPPKQYAGKNDEKAVADKVIEYINSYRSAAATKLPGLTKYAEYRSRQLVTNFAHDVNDERIAATELKYGTLTNPADYGDYESPPYYSVSGGEAIHNGGHRGTIDEVAKKIAACIRDSAPHWAYVGDSKYKYIAVGVTFEKGRWYVDVVVTQTNTD